MWLAKMTFYVPMITFVCGKDFTKMTFCVGKFSLCGQMTYSVTTINCSDFLFVTKMTLYAAMVIFYVVDVFFFFLGGGGNLSFM